MCRLLGMISSAPSAPEWGLVSSPKSLLAQSCASAKAPQRDGWGVAWYKDHHAQWFKSPQAVYDDQRIVRQLAARTFTRVAVAHIRRASNPLGLTRAQLLRIENAQPFAFKNYVLAHNGTLHIPNEMKETLGPRRERVKGVNDSEVLFWLLVNHLEDDCDFRTAFRRTIRDIWAAWRKMKDKPAAEPFTGLNVVFSDGEALHGACYVIKAPKKKNDSLCTRGWPFWRMCWRAGPGPVWLASEPLDAGGDWRALDPGEYFKAAVERGRVRVRVGNL
jgi:predicted glutamine amidotransferase